MQFVFSMYAAVLRWTFKLLGLLGRGAAQQLNGVALNRRNALPKPGAMDYRGLDQSSRAPRHLRGQPFPLGCYLTARGVNGGPVGLPRQSIELNSAVVGPPGSGKTRSVIIPWMVAAVRAGYSVVSIDVKGDMLDSVRAEVARQGSALNVRGRRWDYTDPNRSVRWNWLESLDSDRAIDSAVQSVIGKQPPAKADPYYFHLDGQILRGLLEVAAGSPNRARWSSSRLLSLLKDQAQLERLLLRYPTSPGVARLQSLLQLAPDDFDKRVTGVAVRLDAMARQSVEMVTTNGNFTTTDLLRDQQILTVVAPLQDGQMAQSLSSLFINDLLFRAYDRFKGFSGPPLMIVLDEAAQLTDRIDFKNLLSVARSAGVSVVLAVQDVMQFTDTAERSTVLGNCETMISFSGVSQDSAKFFSERLGKHSVPVTTVGRSSQGWGYQTTASTTQQTQAVIGEREIMNIPFGRRPALVHSKSAASAPFLVDFEA